MPCVFVVVSGDFCRFKLALPSLLSMSKDDAESSPGMIKTNIEQHIYHIRVHKFDKLPVEMNNSRNML